MDLVNALIGFEKVIKHVDDRDVKLSKPTVTSHGEVQRVRGQGMPKKGANGFGDMVVTWEVRPQAGWVIRPFSWGPVWEG